MHGAERPSVMPAAETSSSIDLGACVHEFVALKHQIKEATGALKVMRSASADLLGKIDQEMKRHGKKRLEVQSTGDLIVEQTRKVSRKPKVADMPQIYREVLGDTQAEKLEAHITSLVRHDVVTGIVHRKLKASDANVESKTDDDEIDDDFDDDHGGEN